MRDLKRDLKRLEEHFNNCGFKLKELFEEYQSAAGEDRDQLRYQLSYEIKLQKYRKKKIEELRDQIQEWLCEWSQESANKPLCDRIWHERHSDIKGD